MCLALQGLSHIGIQFRLPAPPQLFQNETYITKEISILSIMPVFLLVLLSLYFFKKNQITF